MGKRSKKNREKPVLSQSEFIENFCGASCWGESCKQPSFCYDFFFTRSPHQFTYHCHDEIRSLRMFNAVVKTGMVCTIDDFDRLFCDVCTFNRSTAGGPCKRFARCMELFMRQVSHKKVTFQSAKIIKKTTKTTHKVVPAIFAGGSDDWIKRFMG